MKRLVIGCGFLGKPLSQRWLDTGDEVFATTRSPKHASKFEECGFTPIVADITQPNSLGRLAGLDVDTVVFAVGMDRTQYQSVHSVYVDGLQNVLDVLALEPQPGSKVPHFVYVSSTGVYGDFAGDWVDETSPTDPRREGGKACLAAEELLRQSAFWDRTTILRMAGLYGGERFPTLAKIKAKAWNSLSPAGYLNLIHQQDAVAAIAAVVEKSLTGETFCVVDSHPTLRRDYYQFIADQFGLGPIPWPAQSTIDPQSRSSSSKRIGNDKLLKATGLVLKHPDFRSGMAELFG